MKRWMKRWMTGWRDEAVTGLRKGRVFLSVEVEK